MWKVGCIRKTFLSAVLLMFCGCCLFAQSDAVRIKAGEDPAKAYSSHGFYQFPSFNNGTAVFKNGGQTAAKFNYHMLNEEMHFIAMNGDTLALADPFSVKYISIDSITFHYSDGYLELITGDELVKLARRIKLNTSSEKIGAYGQASPSGSIRTTNKIILNNTSKDLTLNQNLIIQKDFSYYWLDKFGAALKATKANLLKLLDPDKKNSIEDYLKKNKVDFSKEADLKKLLQFSLL
jgi:hypothetical protein